MDIAALSIALNSVNLNSAVSIKLADKSMELMENSMGSLLEMMPPPAPAGTTGALLDTRA